MECSAVLKTMPFYGLLFSFCCSSPAVADAAVTTVTTVAAAVD